MNFRQISESHRLKTKCDKETNERMEQEKQKLYFHLYKQHMLKETALKISCDYSMGIKIWDFDNFYAKNVKIVSQTACFFIKVTFHFAYEFLPF